MIERGFVDEVLGRVDVVEVIEKRVPLRKAGANYKACCPFHQEKTPSFSVSPTKQFYYCFGCHAHGNAIGFLMNYDRLTFVDAVETLATMVGMTLPKTGFSASQEKFEPLYALLTKLNRYYQHNLQQSKEAQAYLKQRGLSAEVIRQFELGYALDGWDNLSKTFAKSKALQDQLTRTGMLTAKTPGRCYDRFRDRLMFPIKDMRGRVIAFGGRVIAQGEPKYLNSPETPLFHKSRELYGLFEARQACRRLDRVVIVEGYVDVISLAQSGIPYAVATLGTASNASHIHKLLKYTQEVIFCFDGDLAGSKAAWQALQNALPIMRDGIQVRFMFLPRGEDPDSFVRRQGKQAFEDCLKQALPLADFFFERLQAQRNFNTPAVKAGLGKRAAKLLAKLPNGIFKALMLKKLAQTLGVEEVALERLSASTTLAQKASPPDQAAQTKLPAPVQLILRLTLQNPTFLRQAVTEKQLNAVELANTIPAIDVIKQLIKVVSQDEIPTTGQLLEHWRGSQYEGLMANLAAEEALLPAAQLTQEFTQACEALHKLSRDITIEQYFTKAQETGLTANEKQTLQQLLADKAGITVATMV